MKKKTYMEVNGKWTVKVLLVLITYHLSLIASFAQEKIINPDITYAPGRGSCPPLPQE